MAKKNHKIPRLVARKNATLREIYSKARAEFTAADLQKYTEVEEGIPLKQIIAELESSQRAEDGQEPGRKERGRIARLIDQLISTEVSGDVTSRPS